MSDMSDAQVIVNLNDQYIVYSERMVDLYFNTALNYLVSVLQSDIDTM
jgi:hypothetical protein